MKNLCIIVTFYNTSKRNLLYWKEAIKIIQNMGYEIFLLNDSPENNYDEFLPNEILTTSTRNKGKFKALYEFIKEGKIKSKYIKVIDDDDLVLFDFLEKVNEKLENTNYGIVSAPCYRFEPEVWNEISDSLLNKSFTYDNFKDKLEIVYLESFGTSWTILSKDAIFKDEFYEKEMDAMTFLEDQLIGLISYVNNPNRLNIDLNFILYSKEEGVSKVMSFDSLNESLMNLNSYWEIVKKSEFYQEVDFPFKLSYMHSKLKQSFENGIISREEYDYFEKYFTLYENKNIIDIEKVTEISENHANVPNEAFKQKKIISFEKYIKK